MGKLIIFLGGFTTGLVIGVLFIPTRGKDTRVMINHSVQKFAHEFKEKANRQMTHLKSIKNRVIYSVKSKFVGPTEIEKMADVHAWI